MRNPITLKELRLFERFLSAFLILTLIVPSPVYALREIQEGAAESQEISRALTGLEETEEDRITRLAFEEVLRRRGPRSPWARSRWNQALQQKARVQQASAPAFSSGTVAPDWFSIVKPAPTSPTMPVPQINPHAWRPENLPPILADLKEHGIAKVVIGGLVLTVLLAENPDFLYLDLIWESTLAGPVYLGRIDLDISSKYEVVARGAFPREHFQGKAAWYYKDALAEADPGIFRTYRSDSEGWNRVSMLEQALYVRDSVVKRLQWRRQWIERFLIFIALEHLKDRDWLVVDPGNDHSQLLVLLSSYMQGIFAQDYRCFIPQVRKRFADMLKKTPRRAGLEEKDWRAVRVSAIRDGPRYALGRTQSQRTRAVGALMRLGLRTLGEVYARSPRELVGRDGLGEGGIAWLRELFKGWGATWDETWRDPWQSLTDDQQKVLAALYDRWPKRRPYLIAWLALCRLLHHLPLNGELMLVLQQMAEASVDRVRFTSYRAKMVKTLRASEVPQWLETIPHPYRHVDALNLACQAKLPEALEQARYDLEALSRGASTATIHPNVQASAQTTPAILTPWHLQFTQEVLPEAQRRWREIAASLQASRAKQVYNGLVHSLAYREITGRWPNPTQLAEWLGTRPARGAKLSQALTRQFAPLAAHAPEWSFVRPAARIHRDTSPLHRDHIDRVRAELDTFLEHRPPLSAPPMSPATLHEGIVHQPDNVSPNETSPQTLASALTREKRGLQLRSLRESLGLTQAEFGAAVRPEDPIFLTQISRYENGRIVGVPDWLMEQAQQLVREKKRQEALALAIARADEEWTARYPAEVPSAEPSSGATPEEPSAATPVDTTVAPVVRHPWHVQLEQEVPTDVQLRWLAIAAALRAGRAQQVYRAFIHCLACREQLGRWPNSAELHRWLGVRGPRGSELYYELHQRFAPLADEAPDWVFAPPTGRLRHEPVVLDNVARVREELDARLAAASDHLPQPPESRGGALSLVARLREHPGGETTAVALAAWVPMTFSAFRYFRYLELLAAEDAQRAVDGRLPITLIAFDPLEVTGRLLQLIQEDPKPSGVITMTLQETGARMGSPTANALGANPDLVDRLQTALTEAFNGPEPDPEADMAAHTRWALAQTLVARGVTAIRVGRWRTGPQPTRGVSTRGVPDEPALEIPMEPEARATALQAILRDVLEERRHSPRVTANQRAVLRRIYLEAATYDDAAQALEIRPSAVRGRVQHGIDMLGEWLRPYGVARDDVMAALQAFQAAARRQDHRAGDDDQILMGEALPDASDQEPPRYVESLDDLVEGISWVQDLRGRVQVVRAASGEGPQRVVTLAPSPDTPLSPKLDKFIGSGYASMVQRFPANRLRHVDPPLVPESSAHRPRRQTPAPKRVVAPPPAPAAAPRPTLPTPSDQPEPIDGRELPPAVPASGAPVVLRGDLQVTIGLPPVVPPQEASPQSQRIEQIPNDRVPASPPSPSSIADERTSTIHDVLTGMVQTVRAHLRDLARTDPRRLFTPEQLRPYQQTAEVTVLKIQARRREDTEDRGRQGARKSERKHILREQRKHTRHSMSDLETGSALDQTAVDKALRSLIALPAFDEADRLGMVRDHTVSGVVAAATASSLTLEEWQTLAGMVAEAVQAELQRQPVNLDHVLQSVREGLALGEPDLIVQFVQTELSEKAQPSVGGKPASRSTGMEEGAGRLGEEGRQVREVIRWL